MKESYRAAAAGVALFVGLLCLLGYFVYVGQKQPDITKPNPATTLASTTSKSTANRSNSQNTQNAPANPPISVNTKTSKASFKTRSGQVFPLRTYRPLEVNDPAGTQWWTTSTGLQTVWDIEPGETQTTVAVIDTGFGINHEEFTGRWEYNTNEQGAASSESSSKLNCTGQGVPLAQSCNLIDDDFDGVVDNETGIALRENPSQLNCTDQNITLDKSCNMVDDDNNGYVDDDLGWDFASYDRSVQAGQINPDGTGTEHGTAVAGILGATGNNAKGIAGVDWQTKILPIQAIDDESYGNTLTVARAIYYAANRNVDVISLSLGAESPDDYLRQAIHYAMDRGAIVVAASGNDGCNCISYPARYHEVLAVGSNDQGNTPSDFSNYGSALDILAPGSNMITPTWSKTNDTSTYIAGASGTSFATPYVSGLLSLARSHQPDATWGELLNNLLATADHTGLSVSSPTSTTLGSGYSMADDFISRITTPATPTHRYQFAPLSSTVMGSTRVFQCQLPGEFPAAIMYEITRNGRVSFTADYLQYVRAVTRGDATKSLGRFCVGLPGDVPEVLRNINLGTELRTGHKIGY